MYWWNTKRLAEDLRDGLVDEKERLNYFLAGFIAWNIGVLVVIFSAVPFSIDAMLSATFAVVVAVFGVLFCYSVNKDGDNSDFVRRTICLGWSVGVLFVGVSLAILLLAFAAFCLNPEVPGPKPELSAIVAMFRRFWTEIVVGTAFGSAAPCLVILAYYLRIADYLVLASRTKGIEGDLQLEKTPMTGREIGLAFLGVIGFLVIWKLGRLYLPNLVGQPVLADFLTYLAVGFWTVSIGGVVFLLILRRQPTTQT